LVRWSDYTIGIESPAILKVIKKNIDLLKKNKIAVEITKPDYWLDMRYGEKRSDNEDELCTLYNNCAGSCVAIGDNMFYPCWLDYHIRKNIMNKNEKSFSAVPLGPQTEKAVFIEALLGYSDTGYVELCRYCAGHWNVNKYKISPVGEQIKTYKGEALES